MFGIYCPRAVLAGDLTVVSQIGDARVRPVLRIDEVGLSKPADTKEFDLTLAYSTGGFNIGVTDYWFNTPEERYFLYDAHKTSHIFEANVGYDFGAVSIQW